MDLATSGTIHFELGAIKPDAWKALPLLHAAASSSAMGGDPFHSQGSLRATGWHVQSGAGAMNWQISLDVNDAAIGGALADVLRAGAGNDYLIGGAGNDLLDGGASSDMLLGGGGTDTYAFTSNWGTDTLVDSDGLGSITLNGTVLQGGKKVAGAEGLWINTSQGITFALAGSGASQVLVITKDSGSTIRIPNQAAAP